MAFVAVYDACVLFPAPLRDFLLRLARTGLFRAKWSEQILDECFRNVAAKRPGTRPEALARTRTLMNLAVEDCLVTGHEALVSGLSLELLGTLAEQGLVRSVAVLRDATP